MRRSETIFFIILIILLCLIPIVLPANAEVLVSIPGGTVIGNIPPIESSPHVVSWPVKVKLAFDEEYRIHLDNSDSGRRALVKIRIDGRSVTKDGLILRAGEVVDLERFLDAGTLTKGNKFKFVPRSDQALRPENAEDGMVVVVVQYEKDTKPVVRYSEGMVEKGGSSWLPVNNTISLTTGTVTSYDISDKGITVEGSESTQRFEVAKVGELEDRIDTLKIQLVGWWKKPPILLNK